MLKLLPVMGEKNDENDKKLLLCFETNIMQNATKVGTSAGKINSMACNAANLQANITLSGNQHYFTEKKCFIYLSCW